MPRKKDGGYKKAFGEALEKQLQARQMTQHALAVSTGTTPQYLNRLMNQPGPVPASWAHTIATAMGLSHDEHIKLLNAAAFDSGYVLDLTKKD